jgi:hypothetical protein
MLGSLDGLDAKNAKALKLVQPARQYVNFGRHCNHQASTCHNIELHPHFDPHISSFAPTVKMSFDQLSSLESQPTTMRRQDDPQYSDDPEFQRLSQQLMTKLFTLTGNISRLSNEIALLGTKRDTERVRERVHNLLEESKDAFKEVGEGVKKIQSWEDVSVSLRRL